MDDRRNEERVSMARLFEIAHGDRGGVTIVHASCEQVIALQEVFATFTDHGWVIPEWLAQLGLDAADHERRLRTGHGG